MEVDYFLPFQTLDLSTWGPTSLPIWNLFFSIFNIFLSVLSLTTSNSCQLVLQNAGKVRSSAAEDPEKALGLKERKPRNKKRSRS